MNEKNLENYQAILSIGQGQQGNVVLDTRSNDVVLPAAGAGQGT